MNQYINLLGCLNTDILFFLTLDPEVEVSVEKLDLELLLYCVNLL